MVENNADIFLISETKLGDSFPSSQFLTYADLVCLIDMIEIQWLAEFYFI